MNTKQLRQKVLDLAIRGKLVPQDPNDEPASVLLEKIRAEKERLIKEKKIKPDKKNSGAKSHYQQNSIANDKLRMTDVPFEVPEGWVWCRLGNIGLVVTGSTPSKSNLKYYGNDYPFFKPTDLEAGLNTVIACDNLSIEGFDCSRKLPKNSILVTCIGATIGKTGIIRVEGTCNQQINAIIPNTEFLLSEYLYYYCTSTHFQNEIKSNASATTLPILNKGNFEKLFICIPPLAEQHRIVATIETAFAEIDKIEQDKVDLHQFIKQTKGKVLDLAIRGKLVPQDPNDEPASAMLERIGKEQKSKKVSSDKFPYPFEIPKSWAWCRLGEICSFSNGFAFNSKKYKQKGVPLVRISNINNNEVDVENCVYVDNDILDKRFHINKGDLLIAMSGATTGKMGVYKLDKLAYLNQRVGNIKIIDENILCQNYRNHFMDTQGETILKMAYGGAQPNISGEMISSIFISLPPLSEQKRIVSQIEKIFTRLDEIEKTIQA